MGQQIINLTDKHLFILQVSNSYTLINIHKLGRNMTESYSRVLEVFIGSYKTNEF